jgi:hypothetical protein
VLTIPEAEVDTLVALRRFEDQPEQLRDLVVLMTAAEYAGFLAHLTPKQKERYAPLLQRAEVNRATGMTIEELAVEQRAFLESRAAAEGATLEESVADVVEDEGYGDKEATEWEQARDKGTLPAWQRRFRKVVREIKAGAPADVKAMIDHAEDQGGGFVWDPKQVEEYGAFAYTGSGSNAWKLICGFRWVEVAEDDPWRVYGNIAHEMAGHNYYGENEIGIDIAWNALSEEERAAAEAGGNSLFSVYGYQETEIFAELYEYKYDRVDARSDHPFETDAAGNPMFDDEWSHEKGDYEHHGAIHENLLSIQKNFAPIAARGVLAGLGRRVELDPRILPDAKLRFREAVLRVFGYYPT